VLDDQLVSRRVLAGADDLDGAARHDEEWHGAIASLDEHVAALDRTGLSVPADARHLVRGQFRKDVFSSGASRQRGRDRVVGHAALNSIQCMR
jgi:hypothetical protein